MPFFIGTVASLFATTTAVVLVSGIRNPAFVGMLGRRIGVGLNNAAFRRIIENVMARVRGLRIAIARHFPPMRQIALPNRQIAAPHEQNPLQQNAPQQPTPQQNAQQPTPQQNAPQQPTPQQNAPQQPTAQQNAPGTSSNNTNSTALYSEKDRSKRVVSQD
ncbi:hypothetical protein niasHT_004963 [Heterodera trifolii]|uniref:Uncharacterized protein n=1 Tax=Heterodera trifolii TaxID=157864 RepID=A0ABD2M1P4_9BILA